VPAGDWDSRAFTMILDLTAKIIHFVTVQKLSTPRVIDSRRAPFAVQKQPLARILT
jgi:hypothetical protein